MLKKTMCVLLCSLVLQGCVDSYSVNDVIEGSVELNPDIGLLNYKVSVEGLERGCYIYLSKPGNDFWHVEDQQKMLQGVSCFNNKRKLFAQAPDVSSFTWTEADGGFNFTMDATAISVDEEKLNIYTTSSIFVPLTKDLK
ncbi:hypothetical protein [Pseudoalteromonas sp. SG45-1]|uniref:hypothetical protein n=1 Tax=Pseudoalteromonas sp. SG45-1 TaxID=2760957 RepID=UPI0016002F84|nr:hypothetical protein [Pseudoalteromonas sp. SG45-1]MBB1401863.1 hypothetical protein [Pseudoalteromonas sp. SG45-1]